MKGRRRVEWSKKCIHFASDDILSNGVKAPEEQGHHHKVENVGGDEVNKRAGEEDVSVWTPIGRLRSKERVADREDGQL